MKSERIKKCRLSSMMTENVPEPPSEISEILKAVVSVYRRMVERNLGTRISKLGELKWFKRKITAENVKKKKKDNKI